jgi:transposase
MLCGQLSQNQATTKFKIAGPAVARWLKVFHEHGEEGLRSLKVGKIGLLKWLIT